jgi:hypothetical protein
VIAQLNALKCKLVQIWRGKAALVCALILEKDSDIAPTQVVGKDKNDVWFLTGGTGDAGDAGAWAQA